MSMRRQNLRRRIWAVVAAALWLAGCATGAADFELGQTLTGQQKWDEAIRAYQLALEKEPDNAPYKAALAKARAAAADEHLRSATTVAGGMGQIPEVDRGLTAIERALAYDSGHAPSLRFQATLRERRTALTREVERLLGEGRVSIQRQEWTKAEQAAARVLAIDPGNASAAGLRRDAVRGSIETSLKTAAEAEATEDWREAARALEEALGRDPSNQGVQARLRTAQQRDSLAYYLGRAGQLESEGQLEKAFGFLRTAAKYWAADVRLRDTMDRMARDGRRRYYTEALQRAESDDWGRVYAMLSQATQAFGPASRAEPQLRAVTRDLTAKLYERALEFENQKLWG
ncbi:MAG: tetratricopeptide repeat protein, partial [Candidatus Rokuibacteriota bacterium]